MLPLRSAMDWILSAVTISTKAAEMIEWDSRDEQDRLRRILGPHALAMGRAVDAVLRSVGLNLDLPRLDDVATRLILADAGQRVVRIDETTRQAVAETFQEGQALGLSDWELARGSRKVGFGGIDGLFKETWRGRAQTVARTEMTESQLTSARERYLASGVVDQVRIVDGEQDDACASRNGRVVPVTQRVGTAHPNCTVAVVPVLREGA